jgi:DnaJ-class molecular chaperone
MAIAFDCYIELDCTPDATEEHIRRAYRSKAKLVHPDVNSSADAAAQFRKLQEAAVTLLDPATRHAHDVQFGYYKPGKKKGEQNLYTISEAGTRRAQQTVHSWLDGMTVFQDAAYKRNQEIIRNHKRKRRMVFISLIAAVWLIALLIWYFT